MGHVNEANSRKVAISGRKYFTNAVNDFKRKKILILFLKIEGKKQRLHQIHTIIKRGVFIEIGAHRLLLGKIRQGQVPPRPPGSYATLRLDGMYYSHDYTSRIVQSS